MVFQRTQLDEEQVRTDVLARRQDQTGLHDAMRRGLPERADPPLAARQCRRVDLELARLRDVRGSGLERGDIRSVSEFCL